MIAEMRVRSIVGRWHRARSASYSVNDAAKKQVRKNLLLQAKSIFSSRIAATKTYMSAAGNLCQESS